MVTFFRSRLFSFILPFLFLHFQTTFGQQKKDYKVLSIAFYNLENLYDIYDDPATFDDDRTPQGKDRWTAEIYQKKIDNMAYAISRIGKEEIQEFPAVLGVCEIENRQVLEDLISNKNLADANYGIIHYDSPDLRGIDVALLYKNDLFVPQHSAVHELVLYDPKEAQKRLFTRDILVVSGLLDGEQISVIVNHWPSRSGGEKLSSPKREKAALLNRQIIDSLQRKDPYAKIISMGDFNDDPYNKSISKILGAKAQKELTGMRDMYNPMAALSEKGIGSLAYADGWNLFDQIMLSKPLLTKDFSSYSLYKAAVFNPQFLMTPTGQYKGYPFRSFGNGGFTNGYSDHFPVYILLLKQLEGEPGTPRNPGQHEDQSQSVENRK
ncbi:MAG: endonuclease/exonuclease/phosphatase family protein [Salinimicrobium sp.]